MGSLLRRSVIHCYVLYYMLIDAFAFCVFIYNPSNSSSVFLVPSHRHSQKLPSHTVLFSSPLFSFSHSYFPKLNEVAVVPERPPLWYVFVLFVHLCFLSCVFLLTIHLPLPQSPSLPPTITHKLSSYIAILSLHRVSAFYVCCFF